jgi:predicted Zn-dependent protease
VSRLSNLVITPGTVDPRDLEGGLDHGIVVTLVGGARVDPVSYRIVLQVERGWEVRHGRRRRPLAPCELTGNVLETLAHIDPRIGADTTSDWRLGWCVKNGVPLPTGSEAPSLVVDRLEVL